MRRFKPAATAAGLAAFLGLSPSGAQATSLVCQTVNGQTHCIEGEGAVSCLSVNGHTECRQGPPAVPDDSLLQSLPDGVADAIRDLSVEIDGGRIRIRAGGLDLDLE